MLGIGMFLIVYWYIIIYTYIHHNRMKTCVQQQNYKEAQELQNIIRNLA